MVTTATRMPVQGPPPGVRNGQNPTLIPNFDKPVASAAANGADAIGGGSLTPAQYLAANPRADATATATIGGTVTTGDVLTIEVTNPILASPNFGSNAGGSISKTYTTVAGDTIGSIAEAFADLFNDDPTLSQIGFYADTGGTNGAVLTAHHNGPVGNFSVLSKPTEEKSTVTIGGTALTGDSVYVNFAFQAGPPVTVAVPVTTAQSTSTIATAVAAAITANATLAALSITAAAVSAVVTITVPAAAEPVTVSTWVNTAAPTIAITGTLTIGDVLNAIFTGAGIAGSPLTVSYTTQALDTTALMAAGLAAAIAANPVLAGLGISATSSTSTVSISGFGGPNGQVRLTTSVTGAGTETLTPTTPPTDTATLGTAATETITFAPTTGKLSGGTGPVLAASNFTFSFNGAVQAFFYGQPYTLDYPYLTALVTGQEPIV